MTRRVADAPYAESGPGASKSVRVADGFAGAILDPSDNFETGTASDGGGFGDVNLAGALSAAPWAPPPTRYSGAPGVSAIENIEATIRPAVQTGDRGVAVEPARGSAGSPSFGAGVVAATTDPQPAALVNAGAVFSLAADPDPASVDAPQQAASVGPHQPISSRLLATPANGTPAGGGASLSDLAVGSGPLPTGETSLAKTQSAGAAASGAVTTIPQPALTFSIVDVIPTASSAETSQDAETSIAVDPIDPNQMVLGAFTSNFTGGGVQTDFYDTTNGGTSWADYGDEVTLDKTLAWLADGSHVIAATLNTSQDINTYSGTLTSGLSQTTTVGTSGNLDQPWLRTGPSNHVYLSYNDLNNINGNGGTAAVSASSDGGATYTAVVIDKVGAGAGQDAPSVRTAVNGNTVYAAFTRWDSNLGGDASGETLYGSHVVVVRSDNGGDDSFGALGASGDGVTVATPTTVFANTANGLLTLGQERVSADLAIAVDPNNASHVVIAYQNAPGGVGGTQLQLIVSESTDGGATWTTKFTTSASVRSALPALSILKDGTIGLLYDSYDPAANQLSQHLLTTTNDFTSTADTLLGTESNATPTNDYYPYVGDFNDLTSVRNTFYGTFGASNLDNGVAASISNVTYQRDHTGTAGTSSFQLTDGSGNNVAGSIDPYYFTASPACFRRGALIATENGEVAVEDLRVGDCVRTAAGALRRIVWIGYRDLDLTRHRWPMEVFPVRVCAHAFGDGRPRRDLWLSPQHAVFVDGALIPIIRLANGATIRQERVESVSYWHVELESHDVLLAEGLPAESFLDCGGRAAFANYPVFVELHPTFVARSWDDACAPLKESGPLVEALHARLAARALDLGYSRTGDPDLHIIADGRRIAPASDGGCVYQFELPQGLSELRLASRIWRAADDGPARPDRRFLGVVVTGLEVDGRAVDLASLGPG